MKNYPEFPTFFCIDHPLVQHKLTQMRETSCQSFGFRSLLREITLLIGYEISRSLPMTTRHISTPITDMEAPVLNVPNPCIVPVLRAGLGMADGLLDLIPTAQVGHIGVYRDHETKKPVEYLVRLPKSIGQNVFVVDPMLATGNSLVHVCNVLLRHGFSADKISVMALVAAPEGVRTFTTQHPTIPVFCAALDEKLNENAYIVPGLGDAGDRLFGTL
ncbi:MAG: uracil phosphoribosyltransferase [Alphaproteobacteria bacterium]|nr:uracil phosphoribosyltransferase [Alphaproteobacteria bacterium]